MTSIEKNRIFPKEGNRVFFILYSNGDTVYFTVTKQEIYCNELFNGLNKNSKNEMAHSLEILGNKIELKNTTKETISCLKKYNNFNASSEEASIEMVYIDEDLRNYLIAEDRLRYDETASMIPGLLPVQPSIGYSKTRTRNHK